MFSTIFMLLVQLTNPVRLQSTPNELPLTSSTITGIPEEIQGAWENLNSENPPSSKYLYLTTKSQYWIPSFGKSSLQGSLQPSEIRRYLSYYIPISTNEWRFGTLAWPYTHIEGTFKLLNSFTLELHVWERGSSATRSDSPIISIYKRMVPRPGPYYEDFSDVIPSVPKPLHGTWVQESSPAPERMIITPASDHQPFTIRFTPHNISEIPIGGSEQTWTGGVFVDWGPGCWWLRTGQGISGSESCFEIETGGRLKLTTLPLKENRPSEMAPSQIRYFRHSN